ncbi:hypothetical protein CE139_21035 [Pseudomonas oryzihabitans]|uniref:DUF6957 domain-containing protein n=1 Tax=Pseudomonas oryzihabitans TaxID=47885 RepID=A0A2Z5AC73_9PSED|nr:hypothetical protein CE139_21035 [Pseudomonas oryzihabitans]
MMLVFLDMVHDTLGRYPIGGWARTAPMQSFVGERFFETRDFVYVLIGRASAGAPRCPQS